MGNREELYVGADADNASNADILRNLGYNPRDYYVKSKRDGPCGGGGEDSCYVTIESRHHARVTGGYVPPYRDPDEGDIDDDW
ncbi:MAG: hypothetical protein HGA67_03025 [Candidatus Yonathbacteria bacterium]|nr:hypothetical protein [Candidatus Yonathbacteria bacterium]